MGIRCSRQILNRLTRFRTTVQLVPGSFMCDPSVGIQEIDFSSATRSALLEQGNDYLAHPCVPPRHSPRFSPGIFPLFSRSICIRDIHLFYAGNLSVLFHCPGPHRGINQQKSLP